MNAQIRMFSVLLVMAGCSNGCPPTKSAQPFASCESIIEGDGYRHYSSGFARTEAKSKAFAIRGSCYLMCAYEDPTLCSAYEELVETEKEPNPRAGRLQLIDERLKPMLDACISGCVESVNEMEIPVTIVCRAPDTVRKCSVELEYRGRTWQGSIKAQQALLSATRLACRQYCLEADESVKSKCRDPAMASGASEDSCDFKYTPALFEEVNACQRECQASVMMSEVVVEAKCEQAGAGSR